MKKIVCVIMAIILCVGSIPLVVFADEMHLFVTTMGVFSSEYGYDSCRVYIYEDNCYMNIEDIVRYTRSSYEVVGGALKITHGSRSIIIDLNSNSLTEDGNMAQIKTLHKNGVIVVHAFPILSYLGATCSVEDNLLAIVMPEYTIWEGVLPTGYENDYTLETFGGDANRQFILLVNGVLEILESGLCSALCNSGKKEALVLAMQVDPLKYDGAWEIKNTQDKDNGALMTALVAAHDFTDGQDVSLGYLYEFFDALGFDYLKGTNADDPNFVAELKDAKNLGTTVFLALSFFSNLSENEKCTEDSFEMIEAFRRRALPLSAFYLHANEVAAKGGGDSARVLDAARAAAKERIMQEYVVDKAYEQMKLGKAGYVSVASLIEESISISVFINKLLFGDEQFVFAEAQTAALNLMYLKYELEAMLAILADKIISEHYSEVKDIEDYRLLMALYYKTLIAQYEQFKKMLVVEFGEDNLAIADDITNLDATIDEFAKNLHILTMATSKAFPNVKDISMSNQWDSSDIIIANSKEVSNGLDGLGVSSVTIVLDGVNADSIQYFDCAESGNFAVIERNGKYGIIGYDGDIILPVKYTFIGQGGGYGYEYLVANDGRDGYSRYMIDRDGKLVDGYPDGGGVEPELYWYQNECVMFELGYGITTKKNAEKHGRFWFSIDLRGWPNNHVLPVLEMTGYETVNGIPSKAIVKTDKYAFLDVDNEKLLSDFIYEGFDSYNGFSDGLLAVKKNGKWGFVDAEGNIVVDFLYDPYEKYTSYGKTYESVYAAVNGYIAVLKNGKWGLIDTQGNVVVAIAYDGISQVNPDGMFWLQEDGTWSLYKIGS